MTTQTITIVASTSPVGARKAVLYLGTGSTLAANPECFAGNATQGAPSCKHVFTLQRTWQQLRNCNWSAPDTTSRPGFEVRNNTFYIEYEDTFPGGKKGPSRLSYAVSIALPTTVDLSTNVTVNEDSGIKNFNLTGLSYEQNSTGRYLLLDFQMFGRWPNLLTLADITIPGYTATSAVNSYTSPSCLKTSGEMPFTTNDFCYQNGQVAIALGPDVCQVGGTYAFNFDTDCFDDFAVGSRPNNNCKGKVLSANAFIGSGSPLALDLCASIVNTVAQVTATLTADKAEYFFGDTVELTADFTSPDLPIFESRLTNLVLRRNIARRSPNLGDETGVEIDVNTTIVDSAAGPSGVNAIKELGTNTAFAYTPGAEQVVFTMVPNMLPKTEDLEYNAASFLTTDDFDSVITYTYFARFRIYFDAVTASEDPARRRNRRLVYRDVALGARALRQSAEMASDVDTLINVPQDPSKTVIVTPATTSTPSTTIIIGAVVGGVACVALVGGLLMFAAARRRQKRRFEEEAAKSLSKERLIMEATLGMKGSAVPDWNTLTGGANSIATWNSESFKSTSGAY